MEFTAVFYAFGDFLLYCLLFSDPAVPALLSLAALSDLFCVRSSLPRP
jgi:hypothetical protein